MGAYFQVRPPSSLTAIRVHCIVSYGASAYGRGEGALAPAAVRDGVMGSVATSISRARTRSVSMTRSFPTANAGSRRDGKFESGLAGPAFGDCGSRQPGRTRRRRLTHRRESRAFTGFGVGAPAYMNAGYE